MEDGSNGGLGFDFGSSGDLGASAAQRSEPGNSSIGREIGSDTANSSEDPSRARELFGDGTDTGQRKKRGRQPYPRDANGNIIRPGNSASGPTQKAGGKTKEGVVLGKANDRKAVFANISAMHGFVATLTNQPVMALSPPEATAMTDALCNVLDYHGVNITDVTGPWGLYVALALTVYMVEVPRLKAIRAGAKPRVEERAAAAATAGEFDLNSIGPGAMDFTADVDLNSQFN